MPGRTKEGARVSKLYKLKMRGESPKAEEPKVEKKVEPKVEKDLEEEDSE